MNSIQPVPLRSWAALLGLSLLALGIFSLLERLEKQVRSERVVALPEVDYRFDEVEYSALDGKGTLRLRVKASDMSHRRADKTLVLENPRVLRFAEDAQLQSLQATQAQVFEQGERIELIGRVLMQSEDQKALPLTIKTNDLTLLSEEKRAFTKNAVQIHQDGATLRGRGLKADFTTQIVEIEHDVHTVFAPRK